MHQLQIADTLAHLQAVDAQAVVPLRVPRLLPVALAGLLAALALLWVPPRFASWVEAESTPAAGPQVQAEADRLQETMLNDLQQLAETHRQPELDALLAQLKPLVTRLQEPAIGQADALATLSEMQAAVADARAEFDLQAVAAQLRAVGQVLAAAEASREAADALMAGDFDAAAEALEELDTSQLSRLESRTMAEQLEKLAQQMQQDRQETLGKATDQLAEGLAEDDPAASKQGADQLAAVSRQQSLRQSLDKQLAFQLAQLAESKANSRQGSNGGLGRNQSDRPSDNWGRGTTGQPLGDKPTELASQRQRVEITAIRGEGPSQKESVRERQSRQTAQRTYRQQYLQYQKMDEAVLHSEALPLGHRQTIRRYFESIRPSDQPPPK